MGTDACVQQVGVQQVQTRVLSIRCTMSGMGLNCMISFSSSRAFLRSRRAWYSSHIKVPWLACISVVGFPSTSIFWPTKRSHACSSSPSRPVPRRHPAVYLTFLAPAPLSPPCTSKVGRA